MVPVLHTRDASWYHFNFVQVGRRVEVRLCGQEEMVEKRVCVRVCALGAVRHKAQARTIVVRPPRQDPVIAPVITCSRIRTFAASIMTRTAILSALDRSPARASAIALANSIMRALFIFTQFSKFPIDRTTWMVLEERRDDGVSAVCEVVISSSQMSMCVVQEQFRLQKSSWLGHVGCALHVK